MANSQCSKLKMVRSTVRALLGTTLIFSDKEFQSCILSNPMFASVPGGPFGCVQASKPCFGWDSRLKLPPYRQTFFISAGFNRFEYFGPGYTKKIK